MHHSTFRLTAAAALVAAALGMSACSTAEESTPSGAASTSAAADNGFESGKTPSGAVEGAAPPSTTPPNLAQPTVEELNSRINRALDGSVSTEEKLTWVEDADRDPDLIDKLVAAAKENKVTVTITEVGAPADGKLRATANVTIDGKPVENGFVDFVAVGDQWQIAHQFACTVVKSAKLDSAACQQDS